MKQVNAGVTPQMQAESERVAELERKLAAVPNISAWPVFVGVVPSSSVGGGFYRLPLQAVLDSHAGFDPATNLYTIPETGMYRLEMKLRYTDGTPGGISIGLGASTAERDEAAFLWGTTAVVGEGRGTPRNGLLNQRISHFQAGDQIRLYTYCDDFTPQSVSAGELTIDRIR